MPRPVYERESDLERERLCVAEITRHWAVTLRKTPRFYAIDYCLTDEADRVVGWLEIKGKTFPRITYPTFYTAPTAATCRAYEIRIGGRTDRGDADDVEPVAHIPVGEFKPVSLMFAQ